jgi:hypothetical protein
MCKHENSIGSPNDSLRICLDCGRRWLDGFDDTIKYLKDTVDNDYKEASDLDWFKKLPFGIETITPEDLEGGK